MKKINRLTIRKKLFLGYFVAIGVMLGFSVINFYQVNSYVEEIDQVYGTNVSANRLAKQLKKIQDSMYDYLVAKSSDVLGKYYGATSEYEALIQDLNEDTVSDKYLMCEKSIRTISTTYLRKTERTIQAKRGRNVEQYKAYYEESSRLYHYIVDYINNLNNERLNVNSQKYQQLCRDLKGLETVSMLAMFVVSVLCLILLQGFTFGIVHPLSKLAQKAEEVAKGNFEVTLLQTKNQDEIGVVIHAFNTMVKSIAEHVKRIQESNKKEREMKEKELRMEVLLKDARLKYLRAQINPHFLYNSLNTCAQLAMLENAEQTGEFVDRMAAFFRYNVKTTLRDASSLQEELDSVDAYVYIQNVRFAGEIHMTKEIAPGVEGLLIPSMILQPIVENAFNHGIRELGRPGWITLKVIKEADHVEIEIADNGHGMTRERLDQVTKKTKVAPDREKDDHSMEKMRLEQTGIGVDNVMDRLATYYGRNDLFQIDSQGLEMGTKVTITIPLT